ncbi:MAG TPA: 2-oxoisovalerate dehydrogenase [Verrucomicrobia bacterium]|nr:MAG: 2-oxoisovalerate dehydrogenase [Lentisphaerae bacterium GWF2_57_35]HBA85102.1 2-oxoisovalerate dehydrogenase [Verrucomicrobiota bacterium]
MKEIIFEITSDEVDGGYVASALGYGIHTEGDTLEELKTNIRDAMSCHFEQPDEMPKIIRLHFVRDEVMTA